MITAERINSRRFQMAECRRLIRVSDRIIAAAIISIPVVLAVTVFMNWWMIAWSWLPPALVLIGLFLRRLGMDARANANKLRFGRNE